MKRTICFILIIFFTHLLYNCKGKKGEAPQAQAPSYPVLEVTKGEYYITNSYPARIRGLINTEIRAKVTAYINKVLVDEGQSIKKGTPLFQLETQVLSQDAQAAMAQVEAAEIELSRLLPLYEKNIVSKVQVETAEANLKQAESQYSSIMANIDYAFLRSPVTGVVGAIDLRNGSLVSPSSQNPMTTITKIDSVYVYFSMNEKNFLEFTHKYPGSRPEEKLAQFPKVNLVLPNDSMYTHQGRIDTYSGNVKTTTGSVRFRAIFPNPKYLLRDGNSAMVEIPRQYSDVVAIPEMCTYEMQGYTMVYIVNDDNVLESRQIVPIGVSGKLLLVQSNLNEGEIILARGLNKVRHGMKIRPDITTSKELTDSFHPYFPSP